MEAVLFDYGDTLFHFRYEQRTHRRALERLVEVMELAGIDQPALFDEFTVRFQRALAERGEHAEMDYAGLVREVLAAFGVSVDDQRLMRGLHAEHRAWDVSRQLHPSTIALLDELRRRGLRVGLVSNAFDPPSFMHEDLELAGIATRIDAAVFSSELGLRKPHPAIYRSVLERLSVDPKRALFVGDRLLEDVVGPRRLGMRTCLALYFREDEGDHSLADHRIHDPLDVLALIAG